MGDLVVVGFEDEYTAFEMRAALAGLQREYLIDMEDVAVAARDEQGKVRLSQASHLTIAQVLETVPGRERQEVG